MHFPLTEYCRMRRCKLVIKLSAISVVLVVVSFLLYLLLLQSNGRALTEDYQAVPYNRAQPTRTQQFTKNCSVLDSTGSVHRTVVLSNSMDISSQLRSTVLLQDGKPAPFERIIHRMWISSEVPASWSRGVTSCREINPDWLYCHWTDEELAAFIDAEYPDFRSTYDAYPYNIQRSDAVRYLLLYHYGGMYLDLDIVCRLSFENILADVRVNLSPTGSDVMLAEAEPFGIVSDFIGLRRRRDPFMRHVISGLRRSAKTWYPIPYVTVMFSTGPVYLSRCLRDYYDTLLSTGNGTGDVTVVVPGSRYNGIYFGHLEGGSWHSWDGTLIWTVFRLRYRILAVASRCVFVGLAIGLLYKCYYRRQKYVKTFQCVAGTLANLCSRMANMFTIGKKTF